MASVSDSTLSSMSSTATSVASSTISSTSTTTKTSGTASSVNKKLPQTGNVNKNTTGLGAVFGALAAMFALGGKKRRNDND
nr:LPXTG cell wall anchor domain-containing protein [Limosilactobacillus agrestis]